MSGAHLSRSRHARAAVLLLLLVAPLPAAAQTLGGPGMPDVDWRPPPRGLSVGGGLNLSTGAALEGNGRHLDVSVPVLALGRTAHLRAEGSYQSAEIEGGPPACTTVDRFYCLGRSESRRVVGAGAAAVVEYSFLQGRLRPYIVPTALGVYRTTVRGQESQGPTGICMDGTQLVSCPNNPPFASFDVARDDLSLGGSTGAGLGFRVGEWDGFLELRAHQMRFGRGNEGALLLSLGVAF